MSIYVGIDGGGSGSRLAAVNDAGEIIETCTGGTTNLTAATCDAVFDNVKNLFAGICLSECKCIVIGSAGAKIPENARLTREIFTKLGYEKKLVIMSDGELLLAAETRGRPGAVVISGTGSVGFAINHEGAVLRCGGWGHLIDDGGSGYRIGMDAVDATLRHVDGRGRATVLTEMLQKHFGIEEMPQILDIVYSPSFTKKKIAAAALIVAEAAKKGDPAAIEIEVRAAGALSEIAGAMIRNAGLHNRKLILSGSVILRNDNIRRRFCENVLAEFPEVEIAEAGKNPEIGAAFLAREMA